MAMGVNMLSGAFGSLNDMIKNGEVSFSGILGIITSIGMGLPMVISGFSTLSSAIQGTTIAQTMLSALTEKQTIANAKLVTSILAETNAEKLAQIADKAGITVDTLK
jgi:DNA-binding phage protein